MLNENIKALRKQKGYTQETFAQELNVVRQTVSKWEKGYSVPDAVMLEKIAELLEVPVGELLGDTEMKIEEKSDLKQISQQLSLLNNQFAKELARKRRNRKIALIALAVIFALAVGVVILCMVPHEQVYYIDDETGDAVAGKLETVLDKAVSEAVLARHPVDSFLGECPTESHYVFGTDEKDGHVKVYLIEEYSLFGFHNGFFTDVSGGNTPVVFTFEENDEKYQLISCEAAKDGSDYSPSVKKLFPARYARKILNGLSEEENEQLWVNKAKQAQKYLASINRDAVICRYSDIWIELLSDHGISTEVSNKVCEMRLEYDYNIGNHEKLENGKRYVYQTEYDGQKNLITFTKFEYDTKRIVEFFALDSETGEQADVPQPEKVSYYKGRMADNTDRQYTTLAYYGAP